jgi:transposase InsO family protein
MNWTCLPSVFATSLELSTIAYYNLKRRRGYNNQLSLVEYEKQYFLRIGTV